MSHTLSQRLAGFGEHYNHPYKYMTGNARTLLDQRDEARKALLDESATLVLEDMLARLPKPIDHKDYCDLKTSDLAYYNPEDVDCSCDAPAINKVIEDHRAALTAYCIGEGDNKSE